MRLFVALEIPAAVRDNLASLLAALGKAAASASGRQARLVRPENLHVTLKFIGNVDAGTVERIRPLLAEVRSEHPVELRFRNLGFFPNDRRPRVFWAGIQASPNLSSLAAAIDQSLGSLEIPRETREFTPHLTLARFDPPGISAELRSAAQERAQQEFGSLRASEFHLFESKTRPSGAEYTRLSSFRFTAEA